MSRGLGDVYKRQGEGLKMIATYNNPHSYPVIYGLKSTDEMMMIFGWRFQ